MILQRMWEELNTPSDFADDWYGGTTNQLGHIAIGAAFAALVCVLVVVAFGVLPYKWAVFSGLLCVYGIGIERNTQASPLLDGIWDTGFFMLGVSIVLFSLTEAVVDAESVTVRIEEIPALISMGVAALSLLAYAIPRAIRQYRSK